MFLTTTTSVSFAVLLSITPARDTSHYFQRYIQSRSSPKPFCGVTLQELPRLERLFEVNIFVYTLEKAEADGECSDSSSQDYSNYQDPSNVQITGRLLQRSHSKYNSTMYLNLYNDHFSYIRNLNHYSKSFACSRCRKMWKHVASFTGTSEPVTPK